MRKITSLTRRRFLAGAALAAAGAPMIVSARARGAGGAPPPSERLGVASIGFRGQGGGHLRSLIRDKDVRVAGLCDVDYKVLDGGRKSVEQAYGEETAGGTFKGVFATQDFRDLLARPEIDLVVIATPDHWHCPITVAAAKAGKDVYCEKPMSLTLGDGRAAVEAVRRYGRVFQCGSQQRSGREFRTACELVRSGRIGKLQHVEVGIPGNNRTCGPAWEPEPVPPELNYEIWLGPAPWEPYTTLRCHYTFRFLLDYSGGQVTNWGAHHLDIAQWGIGADASGPVAVEGKGEFPTTGLFTTATRVDFTCTYASGVTLRCATALGGGTKFIGTDGWVHVNRGSLKAEPASVLKETIGAGDVRLYEPHGSHMGDFLWCVRNRAEGSATAEIGHRSATICHLGNIAMLLGRKLKWDPAAERFVDDPEANRMIHRPARVPWQFL